MTAAPGADEIRARRNLLRALNSAPTDPAPAPGPAGEGKRARDWLDEILNDPPAPPPAAPRLPNWRTREPLLDTKPPAQEADGEEPAADETEDGWEDEQPAVKGRATPARRPSTAARRAHAAYEGLPARLRAVAYTGSAATLGWGLGLEPLFHGWITTCGRDTSTSGALALGAGLVVATGVLIDRRTRGWWPPLAWACRIPLASALLALALYAPGASS